MDHIAEVEPITKVETLSNSEFSIIVEKQNLLKALSHIQSIVEKKNIIPILSNIKLVAYDNKLELTATDMDIAITEIIDAKVLVDSALTIAANTFYDIVKKLPDNNSIYISTSEENKGKLNIKTNNCQFLVSYLSADEFPIIENLESEHNFKIFSVELKSLINKTKFAISNEETRYNLNGIFFHVEKQNDLKILKSVATDGHRLSYTAISIPEGAENMPDIILPKKAIIELSKIIEDIEEDISVSLSTHKISFTFARIKFVTKLIDASFPEYNNLVPINNDLSLTINKASLAEAVDRIATISFDKSKSIKFFINNDLLEISSVNEEQNRGNERLNINTEIENLEIGFNAKYILDVLSVIENEQVTFEFTDASSATIIRDPTDVCSCFVVMPMRI